VDDRGGNRAAFLDRDGTIIVDRSFANDPDQVTLLPGAAEAIRRLAAAGIPSIVCTNQSGIARGLISLAQYRAVHERLAELLAAEGASLLDTFSCPHHPERTGPCDCRKPAAGLFVRAAALHRLALARCLFAGDRHRDVAAARTFGASAILVRSPVTSAEDAERALLEGASVADSLLDGVEGWLAGAGRP
jgi:histidinol-phosphate phosphatase family protein